jgi:predicted nucleic acid-binding Zn ribbon protein
MAIQTECDRCRAPLAPGAAYCDRCGERTRKAKGMVRLTLRVELLVLALVVLMTVGFVVAFFVQR